jgi:hypothetical protein
MSSSVTRSAAGSVWRRIPWKMIWTVSLWLGSKGKERVQANLSAAEQHEFWTLLKKSRGRPDTLSQRDRTRLKNIADKALRGS